MALDKDRLGLAIAAYFTTDGDLTASEKTAIEDNWKNIAKEIIDEFDNNAELDTASCSGTTGAIPGHSHLITAQPVTGGIK